MATERIPQPTEAAKANWNSDGTTYPSTDPGGAKRATGFKPLNVPSTGPGEIVTANDQNWLHGLWGEMVSWVRDFVPREWSDISDGIAYSTESQLFRVYPPATGTHARGAQIYNIAGTATGGGNVNDVRTDGERIYYFAGSPAQILVAAYPDDGSELWENDPLGAPFSAITVDGSYIYGTTTSPSVVGLRRFSRDSGASVASGGTEYSCAKLVTNGSYCVGIDGQPTGAGYVTFWSGIQGTIAQDGQTNPAPSCNDVAIDSDRVYVAHANAGALDVHCYDLSTRALLWSTGLPVPVVLPANAIATDGDLVYVGTDFGQIAASAGGGYGNLFVLDRLDGSPVDVAAINSSNVSAVGVDIVGLAVDDRYLYAVDSDDNCNIVRLRASHYGMVAQISNLAEPVCDGVSVAGKDIATPANFRRHWVLGATKTFMHAAGDDPNRRPFHTLAVPEDGRI